jgi:molecular chaperone GrpE (heat shock protein)
MNASKFDKIVENRAVERTREKISNFKRQLSDAVRELTNGSVSPAQIGGFWSTQSAKELFTALDTNRWPACLWDQERELVTKELLSVMDEMQKALVAPAPSADGPMPPEKKGQP